MRLAAGSHVVSSEEPLELTSSEAAAAAPRLSGRTPGLVCFHQLSKERNLRAPSPPMDTSARSARNKLFQELKPHCVELSQLALKDDGSAESSKLLVHSTSQLLRTLQGSCQSYDGVFDEKLADYVFFPLSQILRGKQKYTDQLSELTIRCLKLLLEYGWRKTIALDLAAQLLILLTLVAGGIHREDSSHVQQSEELTIEAYGALAALFQSLASTSGGAASLVEASSVPALGHCVTVVLDGIRGGPSAETQTKALQALNCMWRCIKDQEALAGFLPGTVSTLTKCLSPSTTSRRSQTTLVIALEVLQEVLISMLGDLRTSNVRNVESTAKGQTLSTSWFKVTAAQIKLALSTIVRLRTHKSLEVRRALNKLSLALVDECHDTLVESASILVETCMILTEPATEEKHVTRSTTLSDLAMIYPDLGELIKRTAYNWITSLPRVMQSNDEAAKQVALAQLSKAQKLLVDLNLGSTILHNAFVDSLRDCAAVMFDLSASRKTFQDVTFQLDSQASMLLINGNNVNKRFHPLIMFEESQKQTREELTSLLANSGTRSSQLSIAGQMLEYARSASPSNVFPSYWLSFNLVKLAAAKYADIDDLLNASLTLSDDHEAVEVELLSYSLSVLSSADTGSADWRIQALAMEVVADSAQRLQRAFRAELVDVLYPVTELLGSPNLELREHAIVCLNIISESCEYSSTSDLIIDNVDYMVNAISLRLNVFDISPQAPQVLVMMIRLAGPSLLLYLDDVVASIFAALENFHGYDKLVEMLFLVLGEIIEVGSKSNQLQVTAAANAEHPPPSIEDVVEEVRKQLKRHIKDGPTEHQDFPRAPWKDAKTLLDESSGHVDDDRDSSPDQGVTEIQPSPPTKVYSMIQNIARLGQYYLTNPSPVLRRKLLGLISTACSALYNNENEFLPLVNDIWPVVIKRLYDDESFVVIAAADTIGQLCRTGGNFLTTRIQVEWPDILRMARKVQKQMLAQKTGAGSRRMYSQATQVWESMVRLLVAIVKHVPIDDDFFDDVLELLTDLLHRRQDVYDALSLINADAVWLNIHEAEKYKIRSPKMDQFVELIT
ncbi:hypothetical protein B7494_g755 [Chlorociboria aeruginascens]|nr:hypothetical protein B7494_g755 [Chlorociboria aeruginascens]